MLSCAHVYLLDVYNLSIIIFSQHRCERWKETGVTKARLAVRGKNEGKQREEKLPPIDGTPDQAKRDSSKDVHPR